MTLLDNLSAPASLSHGEWLHRHPSSCLTVNRLGLILNTNRAAEALLGCAESHAAGRPWTALIEPDPAITSAVSNALRAGVPYQSNPVAVEIPERNHTKTLVLDVFAEPAIESQRFLMIRDLTAYVLSEYRFQQVRGAEWLRYLCQALGNEFDNVVIGLQACTEDLHSRCRNSANDVDYVRKLREAVEQAALVTQRLRVLGGTVSNGLRPLDLNGVVRSMLPMLESIAGKDLDCFVWADRLPVKAEWTQVQDVIVSLARHAVRQKNGGTVSIRTKFEAVSEHRAMECIDLAPGKHAVLEIRFEKPAMGWRQQLDVLGLHLEGAVNGAPKLDLPRALGLMKQAGGTIVLCHGAPNFTEVRAYWPLSADVQPMGIHPEAKGDGETILLVEHEADSRSWSAEVLLNYGYRVLTAAGGLEALHLVERQKAPAHILLTDLSMPCMGGIELSTRVGKFWPAIKTVYLSTFSVTALISHGLPSAAITVHKPFAAETLARTVHNLLRVRPALTISARA